MVFSEMFPKWNALTPAQKSMLESNAQMRTAEKGTVIHNGILQCTGVILVASGQLRAYTVSPDGREITLYRLFDRDMCLLSASCMLNSIQFEIILETELNTTFWIIPPTVYKQLMEESVAIANLSNEIMADRFSNVMWLMEQILWKSFDKRLADYLLEERALADSDTLHLTHEAIGNHLGNPREVVTRMLRYFQSEGLVEVKRGSITLKNIPELQGLAE